MSENASTENGRNPQSGKTIDLQGVASFAGLVELLAQELGTTAGKMQGHLPTGPATFNQLVGEIEYNSQGFQRKLTLITQPGSPLTLRFECSWSDGRRDQGKGEEFRPNIVADYYLGATVEQITPQGRALARYAEDIFAVLDRMVTLGQSSKLMNMQVSASQLEAFEQAEAGGLVRQFTPKNNSVT